MAFQPINFANVPIQQMPNLVQALMQGFQAGQMPSQMRRQREQEDYQMQRQTRQDELQNAFQQMQMKHLDAQTQGLEREQSDKAWLDDLIRGNGGQQGNQGQMPMPSQSNETPSIMGLFGGSQQNGTNPQQPNSPFSQEDIQDIIRARVGLKPKNDMPFGGEIAPGAVGQAQWLNMIRQKYGENSREFKDALRAHQSELAAQQSLSNQRNVYSENSDKRFATPLGKDLLERADVEAGFMPGTGRQQPISAQERENLLNKYDLKVQKSITDTQTRQKVLNATNAEITMDRINPTDLLQYSGPMGQAKLKKDQALSATGKPPENYLAYKRSLIDAELWAKQLRQTYGDSIQPSMVEKLEKLTNPTNWIDDPKATHEAFNEFAKTTRQELKTFKGALKSTEPYKEKESGSGAAEKKATMKYNATTGTLEKI